MNMRTISTIKSSLTALLLIMAVWSCKKVDNLVIPPVEAHFQFKTSGTFEVLTASSVFKVPVGITTASDKPVVIPFTITSKSGATSGAQYNVSGNSITIPAGQVVGSIDVAGILAAYTGGRKDTLTITLESKAGQVAPISTNSTYTLIVRGPCFEGDVVLSQLLGAYKNTNEIWNNSPYGPYTTTISAVRQITPTTGEITVTNLFDYGWNPVKFILDWTDPNNRTVTLVQQSGIGNAGTITSAYNGSDISVRPFPGQVGTFSICKQTLTLRLQLGVTGLGFFNILYTVNMAR
jgi:hypothetical protein